MNKKQLIVAWVKKSLLPPILILFLFLISANLNSEEYTAKEYITEGHIYALKHQVDKAIESYQKAIEIDPNCIDAYYSLGLLYASREMFDKAIVCFQKVISLNPNYNADVYFSLGQAYYDPDETDSDYSDYNKVIEYCNKAIGLNPDLTYAYYYLGLVYIRLKDYDTAIKYFNKSVSLEPDFVMAYYKLGFIYSKGKGDSDKAIEYYNKAIELDPNLAVAYADLGLAYCEKGRYKEGKNSMRKAIELFKQQNRFEGLQEVVQELEMMLNEIP